MERKHVWALAALAASAVILAAVLAVMTVVRTDSGEENPTGVPADGDGTVTLTYAVHWQEDKQINGVYGEDGQLLAKGLRQYLDEYSALNPGVRFDIRQELYDEYANRLRLLHDTGSAPDIYQIYSTWGPEMVARGMLDAPPEDVRREVEEDYFSSEAATIGGEIWGIPTEINDYALLYDRKLFREAGLAVPETWNDLIRAAVRLTERDERGNIIRYGFAFRPNSYGFVGGPFLSVLYSNGGHFLSEDLTSCRLAEPEGVEAFLAVRRLFDEGATDLNADFWSLGTGQVAMVIAAPWVEGSFRVSVGEGFDDRIGVAPVPFMKRPASLQYSWFMGVMEGSRHKEEAWDFLRWFAFAVQPETGSTRYGDLLARNIGAIPSRHSDIAAHGEALGTPFKSVYVAELPNSVPEFNILEGSRIGDILTEEIQATWNRSKLPEAAAASACARIEDVIRQSAAE